MSEAKMKLENQGGMHRRRKSGRYNVSDTPHVQGPAESTVESCDVFVPATEPSIVSEPMPAPTMDILRSNPLIQQ